MRKLQLTKSGHNKLKSYQKELKALDIVDSLKPIPPGEWCLLTFPGPVDEAWVAHVNSMISDKYACIHVTEVGKSSVLSGFSPEKLIEQKLKSAYERRVRFNGYKEGCRIFYGGSDGLSGLIIDLFSNACIIQINTAGIDRYRDFIKATVSEITGTKAYFLDNPKYREKEFLPTFEVEALPDLSITENGLQYRIPSQVIQKVGFYFDHRENRLQLQNLLSRMNQKPTKGVDLFCYAGSWGFNAMKAGTKKMDFVDQGDFSSTVMEAMKLNHFKDEATFHRTDVFKFLDQAISENRKYDLVLCDPPAFAKSALQKSQALDGYSKLHRKVFKIAEAGAICAFSSCTHYVSHEEFQKNILDASHREGRKIQLLHCGMQGWDHPVDSLDDRSNYIKSYFYILE